MKKFVAVMCLLFVAQLSYASGGDNEWPHWRGPNHNGKVTDDVFKPGPSQGFRVVWKTPLGSGYSSISVSDGQAYTMFSDGESDFMISIDAKTGKEVWRYKIDETYVGHDGSHDGTLSTAAVNDGLVYGVAPKGQIFALDSKNGKKVWSTTMTDLGSPEPDYGWTTSPLIVGNTLIIQTGIEGGKAVSAFDKKSGKLLWSSGEDKIHYQSPTLAKIHGTLQVVCAGGQTVFGLDPKSGATLWEMKHEGGDQAYNPVPVENNRFFIRHSRREGMVFEIEKTEQGYSAKEVWKSNHFKNTDSPSVYHEGHLYGYSGPFLTCVNADTGERVWRSRQPGDGFPMMVNDYLVIFTKEGNLHVAKASPKGFEDLANLEVFDHLGWNPPSFAYGKIFIKNLEEIACIELAKAEATLQVDAPEVTGVLPESKFAAFISKVEAADNKGNLIDKFMEKQKNFPIISEDGKVHVVYRGEVEDLAISGDHLQVGENQPFNRIEGTNFYYFSFEVDDNAHVAYGLLKDFEEPMTDPLNPLKITDLGAFGPDLSEINMPKWSDSYHLKEPTGKQGKLVSFELESKILENKRQIQVYLPPGYDQSEERYPVIYVHYGSFAAKSGNLPRSLDNLIGKSVRPTIAVFIHLNPELMFQEVSGEPREKYAQMLVNEIVPKIDADYRTETSPESRALMGASSGGYISIVTAFKHPGIFGWVVGQSTNVDAPRNVEVKELIASSDKIKTRFFLHWGKFDIHHVEGELDRAMVNREMVEQFKAKGYEVFGGEMPHGYGWSSWRTVNDTILETIFGL